MVLFTQKQGLGFGGGYLRVIGLHTIYIGFPKSRIQRTTKNGKYNLGVRVPHLLVQGLYRGSGVIGAI